MDIRTIFKPVNDARHKNNMERENLILQERLDREKLAKEVRRQKVIAKATAIKAIRNLPLAGEEPINNIILPPGNAISTNQQQGIIHVMAQIDDIVAHDDSDNLIVLNSKKRKLNVRPDNWRIIVEHFLEFGKETTLSSFPLELSIYSPGALTMN
jgi:hypothetical protein